MSQQYETMEKDFRNLKETFNSLGLLSKLVDRQLSANFAFLTEMRKMDTDRLDFSKKSLNGLSHRINEFQHFQKLHCNQLRYHFKLIDDQQMKTKRLLKNVHPVISNISYIFRHSLNEGRAQLMIVSELSQIASGIESDLTLATSDIKNNGNFGSFIKNTFTKLNESLTLKFNELEHKASYLAYNLVSCSKLQPVPDCCQQDTHQSEKIPIFDNKSTSKESGLPGNILKNNNRVSTSEKSELENNCRFSNQPGGPDPQSSPKNSFVLLKTSKKSSTNMKDAGYQEGIVNNLLLNKYLRKDMMSTPTKLNRTEWASPFQFSFINTNEAGSDTEKLINRDEHISSSKLCLPHYKSFNDSYSIKCKDIENDLREKINNSPLTRPLLMKQQGPMSSKTHSISGQTSHPQTFYIKTPFYYSKNTTLNPDSRE
jgi:hypothetical protein